MTKLFNTYFQEIKNVASKGLFHMFTANGLIFIVAFASQLFVAGILEPDDIGRIKIMQTYIGLASLIGGFGFNTSLLKLVASTNSDLEKAQYFNLGLLVSVVSFFILYGLLYLLNDFGMISDDNIITQLFPFYAFSLLPGILQSMYLSYYQAIKEIKKMAVIQLFVKVVSVIVIIVVTYYYGIKGYLIFIPISGILAVVILEGGLKPSLLKRVSSGIDWKHLPIMWSLASFALLANFFGTISMTMDVYLINYLVEDKTQVGYYMFALTMITVFQLLPSSVQQVAFPYFSEKSDNKNSWMLAYRKYNKLNHILVILVVGIGLLIIPPLVRIAFSGKYNSSIIFFIILSMGWLLRSLNIMKGTALMGFGKFNLNFHVSLFDTIIMLPIMFLFIYYFGLYGAAFAKIISGFVVYIISHIVFHRFIKTKFA